MSFPGKVYVGTLSEAVVADRKAALQVPVLCPFVTEILNLCLLSSVFCLLCSVLPHALSSYCRLDQHRDVLVLVLFFCLLTVCLLSSAFFVRGLYSACLSSLFCLFVTCLLNLCLLSSACLSSAFCLLPFCPLSSVFSSCSARLSSVFCLFVFFLLTVFFSVFYLSSLPVFVPVFASVLCAACLRSASLSLSLPALDFVCPTWLTAGLAPQAWVSSVLAGPHGTCKAIQVPNDSELLCALWREINLYTELQHSHMVSFVHCTPL